MAGIRALLWEADSALPLGYLRAGRDLWGNNDSSYFSDTLQCLKVLSYPVSRCEGTLSALHWGPGPGGDTSAPLPSSYLTPPQIGTLLFSVISSLKDNRHPSRVRSIMAHSFLVSDIVLGQPHGATVCHQITPLHTDDSIPGVVPRTVLMT